jgi:hypothetical protein
MFPENFYYMFAFFQLLIPERTEKRQFEQKNPGLIEKTQFDRKSPFQTESYKTDFSEFFCIDSLFSNF